MLGFLPDLRRVAVIALEETDELVSAGAWRIGIFWALVVLMLGLAVGHAVIHQRRIDELREDRTQHPC